VLVSWGNDPEWAWGSVSVTGFRYTVVLILKQSPLRLE